MIIRTGDLYLEKEVGGYFPSFLKEVIQCLQKVLLGERISVTSKKHILKTAHLFRKTMDGTTCHIIRKDKKRVEVTVETILGKHFLDYMPQINGADYRIYLASIASELEKIVISNRTRNFRFDRAEIKKAMIFLQFVMDQRENQPVV